MSEKATSIFIAHIDVVHGCQLRCVGCPNSTLKPKIKRMPLVDFRRILGNIDVDKIHTLRLFNDGEPLLHPNLSELVSIIPEQRFRPSFVEISTNAQHVYWDDFEAMLKHE
ncbi:MAG: radical SAM protein, partial [Wenzhouxiangella sp.]